MKYLPFVAPLLICIPIATYLIFCKLAETTIYILKFVSIFQHTCTCGMQKNWRIEIRDKKKVDFFNNKINCPRIW